MALFPMFVDLKNQDYLVIGALDDLSEQTKIYDSWMARRIHVNCVDSPALRKYLISMIPKGIHELIDKVHTIWQNEAVGKDRQEKIIQMCHNFFDSTSRG